MTRSRQANANPVREVRLVRLVNILRRGRTVSRQALEEELEVSRATLTRDITTLRDQLNMPIAFDRDEGGYVLANRDEHEGPRYELPGIWLSARQAWGVLALANVMVALDPGVLRQTIWPLRSMMKGILNISRDRPPPLEDKLSIEITYRKDYRPEIFRELSAALYKEQQVELAFVGERLSPGRFSLQRFALTQNGWQIDAYDSEARKILRIPVQLVDAVTILAQPAVILERRDHDGEDGDSEEWFDPAWWGSMAHEIIAP